MRYNRAAINRAIEIIDLVDTAALQALTLSYLIQCSAPTDSNPIIGIQKMAAIYEAVSKDALLKGGEWLEHLNVLGLINAIPVNGITRKKYYSYITQDLDGYICDGIQKGSLQHTSALKILRDARFSQQILVDNVFWDGYVRLPLAYKNQIHTLVQAESGQSLLPQQYQALEKVWDLYASNSDALYEIKRKFMLEWEKYDPLKQARIWWDETIPYPFTITPVGKVLAHVNAKRFVPDIPNYT